MKYPLMPVPSSIGTPNGYLFKTNRSREVGDFTIPPDANTLHVADGNAILYRMKEVQAIFKQIGKKIYDVSIMGKSDLLFSTGMYK